MAQPIYLAIDIGASSGRGILSYLEEGKIVTEEIHRFPNHPIEKDGHLIWNVDALHEEIIKALQKAGEINKKPDYIAIDTWGVDYVLLDEAGERIGDCYCYRDTKRHRVNEVHELIPFESLYEKSGIQFQGFNSIYQLYDDKLSGKLAKAKTILMLPDYLSYLLTGKAEWEYTNATTTGLVNAQSHVFDEEIIEKLGYDKNLFPKLAQPGTVLGTLKEDIEKKVGYNIKVVHAASHDTASAVLAIPLKPNEPYISSGTWSLLGLEVKKACRDETARHFNYSNEGSLNYSFRLQKNIMGLWMVQEIRNELDPKPSFAEMVEMAKANPSKKRVDVNSSLFLSPKSMQNAVKSVVGYASLEEIIHIVYASLAESYASSLKELERISGKKFEVLHITGGGGNNNFLNELTAKATGLRVEVGPIEGTALGNILMQMLASHEITSLEEGRNLIRKSIELKEVNP